MSQVLVHTRTYNLTLYNFIYYELDPSDTSLVCSFKVTVIMMISNHNYPLLQIELDIEDFSLVREECCGGGA